MTEKDIREEKEGDGCHSHDHRYEDAESAINICDQILRNFHVLLPFGVLYTINIVVSNWTLGLVSLTMHQTIRATVPAITIILSITCLKRSWREYPMPVYGAITLTVCGVIWATNASQRVQNEEAVGDSLKGSKTNFSGFAWTLFGAVLAVIKTIVSSRLQQPSRTGKWSFDLPSSVLVRYCSLCALFLSLVMATYTGAVSQLLSTISSTPRSSQQDTSRKLQWLWLWLFNALATSLLNVTSFEAVRTCGPLSMGIAGNVKQVVILLVDVVGGEDGKRDLGKDVVVGALVTVMGGIWYAFAKAAGERKRRDVLSS